MPTYAQSTRETGAKLAKQLSEKDNRAMLFFADGFNGDADQLCAALSSSLPMAGALSETCIQVIPTNWLVHKLAVERWQQPFYAAMYVWV